jgi:hypothetical protein
MRWRGVTEPQDVVCCSVGHQGGLQCGADCYRCYARRYLAPLRYRLGLGTGADLRRMESRALVAAKATSGMHCHLLAGA